MKMTNRTVACGLILLLSLFVMFLRMHAISLPAMDKIAKREIHNRHLIKIRNAINKQYTNLPLANRNKLIAKSYKNYIKGNKYLIEEEIKEKANEKKKFYRNRNGYTYVFGIDSYYWLRLIDNLIKKGHIGDRIVDGHDYDDLVDMPIEKSLSKSAHLFFGKFIYKIFSSLKLVNIDYEIGLYFIPLVFSVLLVILTFLITKLLSQSNIAAFFATIVVNLSPLLLKRSMWEWLDTDIYSVFFPLVIFGAFLFVFKSTSIIRRVIGLILFSVSCSIYASIWQGWWYIFDLLIISGVVFIFNDYLSDERDKVLFRTNIIWILSLFFTGLLFVGIFNGRQSCFSFISEPYKLIFALKEVPKDNWPNVFLTVAELKKVAPYRIALELGGIFVFFVTILGSIYLVLSKKIIRDRELGIGFFCLFIWLGVLYYTSLSAIRFALLLIVPLGLMFGIVFDKIIRQAFNLSSKLPKKIHFAVLGILITAIYLFVSFYVTRSLKIASYKFPMMNDAWHNSLTFIKNDSSNTAIINSWWDYGHWFKAAAQRRVLFDGKTQNSPIAFWMAKVLTTDDENEAVGILRMLDISKNEAFDLLKSYGFSHFGSVDILLNSVKLSEAEARRYLKESMDSEKVDKLIPLLFAQDIPEAYFIVSYDMINKMRSISHIGNWNFKKGDIWINAPKNNFNQFLNYLKQEHKYTNEQAASLWSGVSLLSDRDAPRWISRMDVINTESISDKFKDDESLLIFDNGLVIDLSDYSAYVFRGPRVDIGVPYSTIYIKEGVLKEEILEDSNLDYSVLIFKSNEDKYQSIFLDKDLAKSIFARMYFLKGIDLRFFSNVLEEKTPEGNSVFVYKINWPE